MIAHVGTTQPRPPPLVDRPPPVLFVSPNDGVLTRSCVAILNLFISDTNCPPLPCKTLAASDPQTKVAATRYTDDMRYNDHIWVHLCTAGHQTSTVDVFWTRPFLMLETENAMTGAQTSLMGRGSRVGTVGIIPCECLTGVRWTFTRVYRIRIASQPHRTCWNHSLPFIRSVHLVE